MNHSVDINCDMGEGMPEEDLIMPFISSANIACGYHAGDKLVMHKTMELALDYGVVVGAHPSFPDKENFGRTNMHFPDAEITDMVKKQVETLAEVALNFNYSLHHLKPHGALYNMAAKEWNIANAICKAVLETDKNLIIYAQSGSKLIKAAQTAGLRSCSEVFADRTYEADGTLTPRAQPNALLKHSHEVKTQLMQMMNRQQVISTDGKLIPVQMETICIHSDGEHAVAFARTVYELLSHHHIRISSPK